MCKRSMFAEEDAKEGLLDQNEICVQKKMSWKAQNNIEKPWPFSKTLSVVNPMWKQIVLLNWFKSLFAEAEG